MSSQVPVEQLPQAPQALSQQMPPTQNVLTHCVADAQSAPFDAPRVQPPSLQE
jgi:hypothetical protein